MWKEIGFGLVGAALLGSSALALNQSINQEKINDLNATHQEQIIDKDNALAESEAMNKLIISELDVLTADVETLEANYNLLLEKYNQAIEKNNSDETTIANLSATLSETEIALDNANTRIDELVYQLNSSDPVFGKFVDGTLTEVTTLDLAGATSIRPYAFYNSPIVSIEIPETVKSIGNSAFQNCTSLVSVSIPDSLETLGTYVFDGCDALVYSEIDNGKYLGNSTNPYVVLFDVLDVAATEFNVPSGVKIVYDSALYGCNEITELTFPDGVKSFGTQALYGCSALQTLILPNSVISFKSNTFTGCTSLTSVSWDCANVSDGYTFKDGLLTITSSTDGSITNTGNHRYLACLTFSLNIPDGVATNLGKSSFSGFSNLKNVVLGDSITLLGDYCFAQCKALESVIHNAARINQHAFDNCVKLSAFDFSSVEYIGYSAFVSTTALPTNLKFSSNLSFMSSLAFGKCTQLVSVWIPASVTMFPSDTSSSYCPFYRCSSTLSLYFEVGSKPSSWSSIYNKGDSSLYYENITWGVSSSQYDSIIA